MSNKTIRVGKTSRNIDEEAIPDVDGLEGHSYE
jgi:hypothetical protein